MANWVKVKNWKCPPLSGKCGFRLDFLRRGNVRARIPAHTLIWRSPSEHTLFDRETKRRADVVIDSVMDGIDEMGFYQTAHSPFSPVTYGGRCIEHATVFWKTGREKRWTSIENVEFDLDYLNEQFNRSERPDGNCFCYYGKDETYNCEECFLRKRMPAPWSKPATEEEKKNNRLLR